MYVPLWLNYINQRRGLTILADTRQLLGPIYSFPPSNDDDPLGRTPAGLAAADAAPPINCDPNRGVNADPRNFLRSSGLGPRRRISGPSEMIENRFHTKPSLERSSVSAYRTAAAAPTLETSFVRPGSAAGHPHSLMRPKLFSANALIHDS